LRQTQAIDTTYGALKILSRCLWISELLRLIRGNRVAGVLAEMRSIFVGWFRGPRGNAQHFRGVVPGSSRKCAAFSWGGSDVPVCKSSAAAYFLGLWPRSTRDVSNPILRSSCQTELATPYTVPETKADKKKCPARGAIP